MTYQQLVKLSTSLAMMRLGRTSNLIPSRRRADALREKNEALINHLKKQDKNFN